MEKAVTSDIGTRGQTGARVVLLELGCGLRVPSVRLELECVLGDLLKKLISASVTSDHGEISTLASRVTLIRINPDFPENPWPDNVDIRSENDDESSSSQHQPTSSDLLQEMWAARSISLRSGALSALRAIDLELENYVAANRR